MLCYLKTTEKVSSRQRKREREESTKETRVRGRETERAGRDDKDGKMREDAGRTSREK